MMEKVAMPVLLMPAGNDPENLKPGADFYVRQRHVRGPDRGSDDQEGRTECHLPRPGAWLGSSWRPEEAGGFEGRGPSGLERDRIHIGLESQRRTLRT